MHLVFWNSEISVERLFKKIVVRSAKTCSKSLTAKEFKPNFAIYMWSTAEWSGVACPHTGNHSTASDTWKSNVHKRCLASPPRHIFFFFLTLQSTQILLVRHITVKCLDIWHNGYQVPCLYCLHSGPVWMAFIWPIGPWEISVKF